MKLFLASLALSAMLLSTLTLPVFAQAPNLLRGHNPSFEQGVTNWLWDNGGSFPPDFKIAHGGANQQCGEQFLKIPKNTYIPLLSSPRAEIPQSGHYRFTIWLRVKRTSFQDASVDKIQIVFRSGRAVRRYRMPVDQKYLTRWTKHTIDIAVATPWEEAGFDFHLRNSFGGAILLDCAKIERL